MLPGEAYRSAPSHRMSRHFPGMREGGTFQAGGQTSEGLVCPVQGAEETGVGVGR